MADSKVAVKLSSVPGRPNWIHEEGADRATRAALQRFFKRAIRQIESGKLDCHQDGMGKPILFRVAEPEHARGRPKQEIQRDLRDAIAISENGNGTLASVLPISDRQYSGIKEIEANASKSTYYPIIVGIVEGASFATKATDLLPLRFLGFLPRWIRSKPYAEIAGQINGLQISNMKSNENARIWGSPVKVMDGAIRTHTGEYEIRFFADEFSIVKGEHGERGGKVTCNYYFVVKGSNINASLVGALEQGKKEALELHREINPEKIIKSHSLEHWLSEEYKKMAAVLRAMIPRDLEYTVERILYQWH